MKTHISEQRVVSCPVSIAPEYAQNFLRRFEHDTIDLYVRFIIPIRRRVRLRFGLHFDDRPDGRGRDAIAFTWWADRPWLPNLSGTVRFGLV
jgi:hypothetical protein